MSSDNMDKMKKFIADKKSKGGYLQSEKKIGSGKVEKGNKNRGNKPTRTKKIAQ